MKIQDQDLIFYLTNICKMPVTMSVGTPNGRQGIHGNRTTCQAYPVIQHTRGMNFLPLITVISYFDLAAITFLILRLSFRLLALFINFDYLCCYFLCFLSARCVFVKGNGKKGKEKQGKVNSFDNNIIFLIYFEANSFLTNHAKSI